MNKTQGKRIFKKKSQIYNSELWVQAKLGVMPCIAEKCICTCSITYVLCDILQHVDSYVYSQ